MKDSGTLMDWFSSPDRNASVTSAWERLVHDGESRPQTVRRVIEDSWHRCVESSVDPGADRAPPPLEESRLFEFRARNARLVDASLPLIEETREFLSQCGTIMLLTDPGGMILELAGDSRIFEPAGEVRLIPGCDWTELTCGTNAIGTALALQHPVQIHGAEHFCAGIKGWTCSATVIRDPVDGTVLGVIDLSGMTQRYSQQSLALIVSIAGRIESRLEKRALERRLNLIERCMIYRDGTDGMAVVDERGRLVRANSQATVAFARLGVSEGLAKAFPVPDIAAIAQGVVPRHAPDWLHRVQIETIKEGGDTLGYLLVAATASRRPTLRPDALSQAQYQRAPAFSRIVGNSAVLRAALQRAQQLAQAPVPVLLLGETGVGKELFAQGIHQASAMADGPFIALNCGGLSRDLLASDLFGYAEGAFTGARKSGVIGKIEAANRGTLFLDEIGELPLDIQPHLLRVLEEGELYRLGENYPRKVSFRLIAATHRDLRAEVAEGRFRMDLYYRLAVTLVAIPSLRERQDDLPDLIDHWLRALSERYGLGELVFDDEAYECLLNYRWPGNVRELRNAIEGALLTARDGIITVNDLPPEIGTPPIAAGSAGAVPVACYPRSASVQRVPSLEMAEAESIRFAIQQCQGNLTLTAAQLGIAKSTLYEKIKKYQMTDELRLMRSGRAG
jgi:transcriptional regulator of acetoin/glycerol metabolism